MLGCFTVWHECYLTLHYLAALVQLMLFKSSITTCVMQVRLGGQLLNWSEWTMPEYLYTIIQYLDLI